MSSQFTKNRLFGSDCAGYHLMILLKAIIDRWQELDKDQQPTLQKTLTTQ